MVSRQGLDSWSRTSTTAIISLVYWSISARQRLEWEWEENQWNEKRLECSYHLSGQDDGSRHHLDVKKLFCGGIRQQAGKFVLRSLCQMTHEIAVWPETSIINVSARFILSRQNVWVDQLNHHDQVIPIGCFFLKSSMRYARFTKDSWSTFS